MALLALGCAALYAGKADQPYAIVAGTVFQENGFSLHDAAVTLRPKDPTVLPKFKKISTVTDARGEFSFRVPAVAATYIVRASQKGFQPSEKEAVIEGGEHLETTRVDVTIVLPVESKRGQPESK